MVRRSRDGSTWRIGTDAEVAWIADSTFTGLTITAAIPPVFEAYATVVLPDRGEGQDKHDGAVLVRPDGYIGAITTQQAALDAYGNRLLPNGGSAHRDRKGGVSSEVAQ